jgi:hypothetical protein
VLIGFITRAMSLILIVVDCSVKSAARTTLPDVKIARSFCAMTVLEHSAV